MLHSDQNAENAKYNKTMKNCLHKYVIGLFPGIILFGFHTQANSKI